MIDVLIHAGPSLPPPARPVLDCWAWRPPAMAGDALRAIPLKPRVFVLVDGVFDDACAIRHKEILELLAAGVRVVGAASMGALRAAELHNFGMEGVGRIFDAYAAGRLMSDDEVALLHGPAELEWHPFTVPLVNIRATLAQARRRRLIGRGEARLVLDRARETAFTERTWSALLGGLAAPPAFAAFCTAGGVDLKRQDALAAIPCALDRREATVWPQPPRTPFTAALARIVNDEGQDRRAGP